MIDHGEGPIGCPHCRTPLEVPAILEAFACKCGRYSAKRGPNASTYIVRGPSGPVFKAFETSLWMACTPPGVAGSIG